MHPGPDVAGGCLPVSAAQQSLASLQLIIEGMHKLLGCVCEMRLWLLLAAAVLSSSWAVPSQVPGTLC